MKTTLSKSTVRYSFCKENSQLLYVFERPHVKRISSDASLTMLKKKKEQNRTLTSESDLISEKVEGQEIIFANAYTKRPTFIKVDNIYIIVSHEVMLYSYSVGLIPL